MSDLDTHSWPIVGLVTRTSVCLGQVVSKEVVSKEVTMQWWVWCQVVSKEMTRIHIHLIGGPQIRTGIASLGGHRYVLALGGHIYVLASRHCVATDTYWHWVATYMVKHCTVYTNTNPNQYRPWSALLTLTLTLALTVTLKLTLTLTLPPILTVTLTRTLPLPLTLI